MNEWAVQRTDVLRMILRESALLVLIGLAIGVRAALVTPRLIESLQFG